MELPCPHGCGPTWKHPAAEQDRVIDTDIPDDRPARVQGQVDAMEAGGRDSECGEFLYQALARSGYAWDRHGRRQS
ncbi:hypothetical protein [Kibdelosporangium phytohabitans]|uniref:Uncharacterized protein n=1 Tax=Kibdelosporangium phytohabitans TaxID=860235 RepID=A0A0N9IAG0_9PSEU|nr:hypothetical protein [Kibdelosporangium phytohabitans]ALG12076.1 hypothetical protein AOZ06_39065 [Kibdelosporangium phytohabitans]MBE1463563.1 hypothetical protein [Kibdelosporangium phytohabitans]